MCNFLLLTSKTGTNVYPLTKVLLAQKEKMADNSEEKMANNSERDTDISFGGSWFVMSMLIRKWIEKWRSYRYRFVPWIAWNLRKRCDFTWLNIKIILTVTWRHPNPSALYVTLFFLCPARFRPGVFTFAMVVSHFTWFLQICLRYNSHELSLACQIGSIFEQLLTYPSPSLPSNSQLIKS